MKRVCIALLLLAVFGTGAVAEPAGPAVHTDLGMEAAGLSINIGSTMFAFYQMNHHDQLVIISTLKYCGAEDLAGRVVDSLPDLATFFLKGNPQQLLYDLVNKEAMKSGYELKSKEEFDLISDQSLIQGQAYFIGYLKGYQVAMETFFDKKGMEPFCKAAVHEAGAYIKEESLVSQSR